MSDNIQSSPIGHQIRSMRKIRGLSLDEVARRAGTSAPALHRYEAGWDRFELATLRRIAAALGASLEVRLLAAEASPSAAEPDARQLRHILAPLFWDKPLATADLHAYPRWVLGRVLTNGNRSQVQAARRFYGDAAIRDAIARRGIDVRTRNYWAIILGNTHASESTRPAKLEHRT